jgi:ribonuclease P protein component
LEADGKRLKIIPVGDVHEELPRRAILRGRKNFVHLYRYSNRIEGSLLSCFTAILPNPSDVNVKFCFAVSVHRRVGSAVKRNKIKRWIREAYRRKAKVLYNHASCVDSPIAVLFSYRKHESSETIRYADIERDVQNILEKIIHVKEWQ